MTNMVYVRDANFMDFLQEGDICDIVEGYTVYADVPRHFVYSNRKGDFSLDRAAVKIQGELSYLAGRHVVCKTALDGGSTAGAAPIDEFPNGYHVYCERMDDRKRVDFYQSGSFTAMITQLQPVGKAILQWVSKVNAP